MLAPRGRPAALLIGAAPVLGLLLILRSSPWVIVPVTVGIAVLVFTGVSLGADGSRLTVTFPGLAARTGLALGHLGLGPGLLSPGGPRRTGWRAGGPSPWVAGRCWACRS